MAAKSTQLRAADGRSLNVSSNAGHGPRLRSRGGQLQITLIAFVLGPAVCGCLHSATGSGAALIVQHNSTVLARFAMPQLQGLPQVEIVTPQSHGAQVQKGPTVRSILGAAGAIDVGTVRVEGRDPAQTLTAAELTNQVILNVTKRGTLKLAGTNLGRDRRVRDVTSLVVNP